MYTVEDKYKIHKELTDKLNPLYVAKNTDYDDSFGKSIDDSGYLAAITRMEDKMRRIKALLSKVEGNQKVANESIQDTLMDLANYSLMLATEVELRTNNID